MVTKGSLVGTAPRVLFQLGLGLQFGSSFGLPYWFDHISQTVTRFEPNDIGLESPKHLLSI